MVMMPPQVAALDGNGATPAKTPTPRSNSPRGNTPPAAPRLSGVTQTLREARLKTAAWVLIIVVFLLMAWRLLGSPSPNLWPLNVAIITVIATTLGIMSTRHPMPAFELAVAEYVIFGAMCVYIAVRDYYGLVFGSHDDTNLFATVRGALIVCILIMFTYAILIPNTWRIAARMIIIIGLMPPITIMIVAFTHPDILRAVRESASHGLISENALFIAISMCLSIYGTHVLNTLRTEVFEAKELNQYNLVRLIGSGGMGDVYLAEHRMMKRPCALKLIRPDRADDQRSLARFSQEVQATSRLSHPNTIEVYDYGRTEDGRFYYVMEFLPGLSLQDLLEEYGPMPAARVVFLLRQACGALAEAHATGLIHRDLKPANIFAAQRGGRFDVAKLLDFGLVKDTNSDSGDGITRENTVQGTPLYMAPEQALGKHIDHRIDIYAMGGIAYALLTGRPPFDRPSRMGVMAAHARDPVEPPSQHNSKIPPELEAIILTCLSKNADDRYPSADALERALASCACAGDWSFAEAKLWWEQNELNRNRSGDEAVTHTTL